MENIETGPKGSHCSIFLVFLSVLQEFGITVSDFILLINSSSGLVHSSLIFYNFLISLLGFYLTVCFGDGELGENHLKMSYFHKHCHSSIYILTSIALSLIVSIKFTGTIEITKL